MPAVASHETRPERRIRRTGSAVNIVTRVLRKADAYALLTVLVQLALATDAASAEEGGKGHGYVTAEYQYITTDGFESTIGKLNSGKTETHTMYFEAGYNVTDRFSVAVGLPLIRKRYQGATPHDPAGLDPPNNTAPFIDDGEYHTHWQDFFLEVRYLAREGALSIEPFASLGIPSNDYPFFAAAAPGQNLTKFEVGTEFTYVPPISDAFFRLGIGRVFVEETLGVSIDHWRVYGDAGYFFGPRMSGRVFFLLKDGSGLEFPDDFPTPRTDEHWYQHDRMVKHNYMNVGVGLDWVVNEKYALSTSIITMTWADQVFIVDYSATVALTRSF